MAQADQGTKGADDPRLSLLEELQDKLSSSPRASSFETVIQSAFEEGIRLSWREVRWLVERQRRGSSLLFWPDYLVELLVKLLGDWKPATTLDLGAGTGALASGLYEAGLSGEITGLIRGPALVHQLAKDAVQAGAPITFHHGGLASLRPGATWDLVLAAALQPSSGRQWKEGRKPQDDVGGALEEVVIATGCSLLSETGRAAILAPNGFFFRPGLRRALRDVGLFVDAVVAIPPGTVAVTSVELQLVLLCRDEPAEMFVCQPTPTQGFDELLANYRLRRPGGFPALGRLVAEDAYRGFGSLVLSEEATAGLMALGLPMTSVDACTHAVLKGDVKVRGGTAVIFLPKLSERPAGATLADTGLQSAKGCLQLRMRHDSEVTADFAIGFLNSPLGRKVRRAASGGVLGALSRDAAEKIQIPVPPDEQQQQLVQIDSRLLELETIYRRKRAELWTQPDRVRQFGRELEKIDLSNGFEGWLESIPFPIASILWRSHAEVSRAKQVDFLYFGLEAIAHFAINVLMSWVRRDESWWQEALSKHTKPSRSGAWNRAAFGTWTTTGQRLGGFLRGLGEAAETHDRVTTLLGSSDQGLLDALCSERLYSVLERARLDRNKWKGHGGVVGAERLDAQQQKLRLLTSQVSELIGTNFEEWQLLRAGTMRFRKPTYFTECEVLMGTRPDHKKVEIETLEAMNTGRLYLKAKSSPYPVEFTPLVQLKKGPETNAMACYFYSEVDDGTVRWVSYHFEPESEIKDDDEDALSFIAELNG